jgi:hypothetical protein
MCNFISSLSWFLNNPLFIDGFAWSLALCLLILRFWIELVWHFQVFNESFGIIYIIGYIFGNTFPHFKFFIIYLLQQSNILLIQYFYQCCLFYKYETVRAGNSLKIKLITGTPKYLLPKIIIADLCYLYIAW